MLSLGHLASTVMWLLLVWTTTLPLQLTNARYASCAVGEKCRMWAEEGGPAELPCSLSPQKLAHSQEQLYRGLSIRWVRRENSSRKKYHLVLKVERSGLKKMAHSMMHRATVWDPGFLKGNFSLQIEPLLKDDAGSYEAIVRSGNEVWNCHLELGVVLVTASPPGPLVASEPFRLTCNSTHPGKPTKTSWFHAGLLIQNSGRFSSLDQSLFVSRSVQSDSGPWTCELTFADGERISATYNLRIIGFTEPTSPVVYAAAGADASLPCNLNYHPTDTGVPGLTVHWTREESKAKLPPTHGNSGNFPLHLPAVGLNDTGCYLCKATIRSTTITKNVTLAVITVTQAVTEASHLLLICNLSFYAGNERFQWKHLDEVDTNHSSPEVSPKRLEVSRQGSTLEFSQVLPEDEGTWECRVHAADKLLGSVQHQLNITLSFGTKHPGPDPITYFKCPMNSKHALICYKLHDLHLTQVSSLAEGRALLSVSPRNFPALDRIVAATLPGKGVKDVIQKEKALQTE
ncbi:lymphocyte activation gene 3 protein [Varanus komodoensis]|uniref:lymphocyte activation gene 3 protein n=1 Tax=Varanus komodoensis TaxID=61221 RepID=UPI001CF7C82B|nr:lymphocyte activation gene 3 protein [Varanus komodoensis]